MYRILILIIVVLVFTSTILAKANEKYNYKYKNVEINGNVFNLEVADSDLLQTIGLMYRDNLNENSGMLFIMDKPMKAAFWMKNMNFPIDMVFIKQNKIVTIIEDIPVCKKESCPRYRSKDMIDSVIEFNSGTCKKYSISAGQKITIQNQ